MLKLAKAAREECAEKFTFLESDGQTWGDFCTAYNVHIHLEDLSKAIAFCVIGDVFKILPRDKILLLWIKLKDYFSLQSLLNDSGDALVTSPSDTSLKESSEKAVERREATISALEDMPLGPTDLLANCKGIEEGEDRMSSRCY